MPSSQVLLLVDMDLCIPLMRLNNPKTFPADASGSEVTATASASSSQLLAMLSELKRTMLRMLCAQSSSTMSNAAAAELVQFSFRFYSSTGYFVAQNSNRGAAKASEFKVLSADSYEELSDTLSDHFERVIASDGAGGAATSFSADTLERHYEAAVASVRGRARPRASEAENLAKALQEIAVLYDWDRPNLHSPVKSSRTQKSVRNVVAVFTKVPSDKQELETFLGGKKRVKASDVQNDIFKGCKFKSDSGIGVNLIDTSGLYDDLIVPIEVPDDSESNDGTLPTFHEGQANFYKTIGIDQSKPSPTLPPADPKLVAERSHVKGLFQKCMKNQHGGLIPVDMARQRLRSSTAAFVEPWAVPSLLLLKGETQRVTETTQTQESESLNLLKALQKSALAALALASDSGPVSLLGMGGGRKRRRQQSPPLPSTSTAEAASTSSDREAKRARRTGSAADLFSRRTSNDSISSAKSAGSKTSSANSRAAEMMRLSKGQQHADRGRRRRANSFRSNGENISPFEAERTAFKERAMNKMEPIVKAAEEAWSRVMAGSDEQQNLLEDLELNVVGGLCELQLDVLRNDRSDACLTGLAEATIQSLLQHLGSVFGSKTTLENIVATNFLVDPMTVGTRKTSLDVGGRIRDHKLQVLYRMEVHWLTACPYKQADFKSDMLAHLVQITNWHSAAERTRFLNESLTPVYLKQQPELLCWIYAELNISRPPALADIFSPQKSVGCPSVCPSSVLSDASFTSAAGAAVAAATATSKSVRRNLTQENQEVLQKERSAKMEKLKRRFEIASSARPVMQISVKPTSSKSRQKGHRSKDKKGKKAAVVVKKPASRVKLERVSGPSTSSAKLKAKRNLCFDSRSPRKKGTATGSALPTLTTPKKLMTDSATPRKKKLGTPKRMTPGKTHHVLAPETPSRKSGLVGNSRGRKSDGVHYVKDSPDVVASKRAGSSAIAAADEEEEGATLKTTPRRMNASLALRRKASFYESDNVSRNLLRAEEVVEASRFETQTVFATESAEAAKDAAGSACDLRGATTRGKRGSLQLIFPHLTVREDEATQQQPMQTPKKNDGGGAHDVSPAKSNLLFSPGRKVAFNMARQRPTPRGKGKTARSILKTPSKGGDTPVKASPVKAVVHPTTADDPLQRYQERIGTPLKEQIQPRSPWSVDPLQKYQERAGTPLKDRVKRRAEIQPESRVIRQGKMHKSPEEEEEGEEDDALIPLPDTPIRKSPDAVAAMESERLSSPQSSPSVKSAVFEPIPDATDDACVAFITVKRKGAGEKVQDADGCDREEARALGVALEKKIGQKEGGGKPVVEIKLKRDDALPKPGAADKRRKEKTVGEGGASPFERRNSGRRRSATTRLGIDDFSLLHVLTPNKIRDVVKADGGGCGDGHTSLFPGKEDEEEVSQESETPSRHSARKRHLTERLGIDDITLSVVISPRSNLRQRQGSSCNLEPQTDLKNEERQPSPKPPSTPASNKKSRLRSTAKRKLIQSPGHRKGKSEPKSVRLTIAEDSDSDAILDVNPEASNGNNQWTVAEVSESPRGEIKMKINRGRASATASPVAAAAAAPVLPQRLSRRVAHEIGMSPGKLNKMLLGSPSPSRKRPREEPKYSPLTPRGIYDLTKSPLLDDVKRRRNRIDN